MIANGLCVPAKEATMRKGDLIGQGTEGTYSWSVTFVDGVGEHGIDAGAPVDEDLHVRA
jgi:hypothetical protein